MAFRHNFCAYIFEESLKTVHVKVHAREAKSSLKLKQHEHLNPGDSTSVFVLGGIANAGLGPLQSG